MARIPEQEIERLVNEVSAEGLVEAAEFMAKPARAAFRGDKTQPDLRAASAP